MWNEAIDEFSKTFETWTGQWILLTKYTVDIFRGNIFFVSFFFVVVLLKFYFFKVLLGLNSTIVTAPLRLSSRLM